jgi:4-amino-4-deoxy-L-arabinose transferase-like glycosyltransferase
MNPLPQEARPVRSAIRWSMILLAVAVVRIAATYTVFSETLDEPVHLAAGLEIYTRHVYVVQNLNPPLPRLLFALGPLLDGVRLDGLDPIWDRLSEVFQKGKGYRRTLALARAGNLLFFLIAAVAVWMWARKEAGELAGLATMFLFTTEPVVLGYFGLIAHDGAAAAGVALAMLAFLRWIESPSVVNAILLGAAYGFGIACKFSCIVFIPLACVAVLITRVILDRRLPGQPLRLLATTVLIPMMAGLIVWASYGFAIGEATDFGAEALARVGIHGRVPAPVFITGLARLAHINKGEYNSFLFGSSSKTGWWWYFPAAMALKTTVSLLLLAIAGLFATWSVPAFRRLYIQSVAAAAAMLAISTTSHLDIGIRYVLPVYVPLSVAGGVAIVSLLQKRNRWLHYAGIGLIAWQLGASVRAHPDYFPYFNAFAGSDPSRYLIDSNLDWGQDLLRLAKVTRQLHIERLGIALFASGDPNALHLPERYWLNPRAPSMGWVAISDHLYRMEGTRGDWQWLRGHPHRMVGKSIRLYYMQ